MTVVGRSSRTALLLTPSLCFALQARRFASTAAPITVREPVEPEHLVVLIHGLGGSHNDLNYLAKAVFAAGGDKVHCHAIAANSGLRTIDGMVKGGRRAVDEVRLVAQQMPSLKRISVVGNSLGGLYARYMISQLVDSGKGDMDAVTLCGMMPAAFVTIASPHLGCANLTYWPLPETLEKVFAAVLQETGDDLFRNDADSLLRQMAIEEQYLGPLRAFQRRRVYGNLRGDFLVLPESALFMPNPEKIKMWRRYAVLSHAAAKDEDPQKIQKKLDEIDKAAEAQTAAMLAEKKAREAGEDLTQGGQRSWLRGVSSAWKFVSNFRTISIREQLERLMQSEESLGRIVAIFESHTSQIPNLEALENPSRLVGITRILKALEEGERLPPQLRDTFRQPLRALQQLQLPQLELPARDGMVLPSIPSTKVSVDEELQMMASSLDRLGWSKVLVDFPNSRLPLNHNRICALARDPLAEIMWQGGRGIMDDAAQFILHEPRPLPDAEAIERAFERNDGY